MSLHGEALGSPIDAGSGEAFSSRSRRAARECAFWLWQRRWVVALNLFLLSPLFTYELRIGDGGPDRSFAFLLPVSLAWLALVHSLTRRPLYAHLALFPLYLTTTVDLYLIANYRMRLGSSTILVIAENLEDSVEYLKAYGGKLAATSAAFIGFYATALWKIRHWREPRRLGLTLSGDRCPREDAWH